MNSRRLDRIKYIGQRVIDRTKDSYFNFTHAHLIRNMVTVSELDLVKREPCDKGLILIAFYPTGGFGDYIISSKLLDELLLSVPCRIDVYCENMLFGQAVYGARPGVQVLPYDSMYGNRMMYDLILWVEHFIHVLSWNAYRAAKICPEFADKIRILGKSIKNIRPEIEQQWFREAMHFRRCQLLGINRWTELRHGSVFQIPDQYSYIDLKTQCLSRIRELNLLDCRYITINRGSDGMGRTTVQTKVWPKEHYERLVSLFKKKYRAIKVIQLGTANNARISGADGYMLGESMEVTKWVLRGSMLHIDCEGGLVHLAAQLAVTCIVLFGPTPAHMYAYPANINLVSHKCSNCMGTHPDWAFSCYKGFKDPECMYSLTADHVMSHIENFMNEKGRQREKEITQIDIQIDSENQKHFDLLEIYKKCRSKNQQLTISKKYKRLYTKVLEQTENSIRPMKVAVVDAGRDFIGWYLAELGLSVTEFDQSYGYSGKKGDISFNKFTKCCIDHGMDMRLGDEYNLPYASESFDFVVQLAGSKADRTDQREVRRILKNCGILITFHSPGMCINGTCSR